MQFHEYLDTKQTDESHKEVPVKDYYAYLNDKLSNDKSIFKDNETQAIETIWWNERRPFYNVYPAVTKCLVNTRLEFHIEDLGIDLYAIAICFAKGHEPVLNGDKVASILFNLLSTKESGLPPGMFVCWNTVDCQRWHTIMKAHESKICDRKGIDKASDIISLCVGVAMLAKDERFAEPILLKRDQARTLTPEQRQAAIERAIRNGRNGIAIGKDIEVSPHVRRPHFGIRWTGKGREVPKLVPIAGSLVSRSRLYPLPTGYLGGGE
jgi:hypothetical protein